MKKNWNTFKNCGTSMI